MANDKRNLVIGILFAAFVVILMLAVMGGMR